MASPLPILALPDFESLTLDRLALCNAEITGLHKVFRQPPGNELPAEAYPCCYVLIGQMPIQIPSQMAGSYTVTRNYIVRVLGSTAEGTLDNSATAGAQGLVDITPFFSRFRNYYLGHPQLQTTTLDSLQYVFSQLLYSDGEGLVTRPAPGGTNHFAIDITLTITHRAQLQTLA